MNLRVGGQEKYQSAFYVYEELVQTDQFASPSSGVGQAVSEILLGRWEEAEGGLQTVMGKEGGDSVDAVANAAVLACVMGRKGEVEGLMERLSGMDEGHALVLGCQEKSVMFDEAARKYSPKVATAA